MDKKKTSLGKKTIIGLAIGIIAGAALSFIPEGFFKDTLILDGICKLVGTGYTNLVKMTMIPFVFTSLIAGVSSASDARQVGRIGGKIVSIYACSTIIAALFGVLSGFLFKPGAGVVLGSFDLSTEVAASGNTNLADVVLNFIPTNIFESAANGQLIHILIFALFVGVVITMLGDKVQPVKELNYALMEIMLRIINIIMKLTPYGVCALMVTTVTSMGLNSMLALGKYVVIEIAMLIVFFFAVYGLLFTVLTKLNFFKVVKAYSKIAMVPFSTSSSNVTLPYTIQMCKDLGVSNEICSFTIPLGATINMNGAALMHGLTFLFICQIYGIEPTLQMTVTVIFTALLATMGAPGIPGTSLISMTVVLGSVGLPLEMAAIIYAIDRVPDMFKTVVNVFGDVVGTIIVAKNEGLLDIDAFNGKKEAIET